MHNGGGGGYHFGGFGWGGGYGHAGGKGSAAEAMADEKLDKLVNKFRKKFNVEVIEIEED
jgi:hypothetical protein